MTEQIKRSISCDVKNCDVTEEMPSNYPYSSSWRPPDWGYLDLGSVQTMGQDNTSKDLCPIHVKVMKKIISVGVGGVDGIDLRPEITDQI